MFYKRAGHAEISENLIYSKIVSLFENVLIFGKWVTTPKLDVESFCLILVVCRDLFYLSRISSIIDSSFYILSSTFYLVEFLIVSYFYSFLLSNHTRFKDCFREMFSNKSHCSISVLIEYIGIVVRVGSELDYLYWLGCARVHLP